MMKPLLVPALLASVLFSAGLTAAPALANDPIAATRNGAPVLLRAEYVPASQFAAATQAQIPPAGTPAPGYAQTYAPPAYLPIETYRANQQRANPDDATSLAGFFDAGANRAAYQPRQAAGWQAAYQPGNDQPAYEQASYDQVSYDRGQYDQGQYDRAGDQRAADEQAAYEQAGYQQQAGYGQYAPPPATIIHSRSVVPVYYPVPVGYAVRGGWGGARGGWGGARGGWNGGWNRGWGGGWNGGFNRRFNGGWGGGWNHPRNFGGIGVGIGGGWGGGWGGGFGGYGTGRGGYYGNRGWGCRSTGSGALVGSVAGATLGYGLANRWNRGTGVVLGGIVGAIAGSAIERSGRC